MSSRTPIPIHLDKLFIDQTNPRFPPRESQNEALYLLATDKKVKLFKLAEDIARQGLNPSESILVESLDGGDDYIVLEGNRRVAALKLVSSAELIQDLGLPSPLQKRFLTLHESSKGNLPTYITCAVSSRAEAKRWIELKHTGENAGVGVVQWDGPQRHRFRGSSPALEIIDLVATTDYIDSDTRARLPQMSITNLSRLLGNPRAREMLGVDVKRDQLLVDRTDEEVKQRWAQVITDFAQKKRKVTDIDNASQQIEYAREVVARPLTPPISPTVGSVGDLPLAPTSGSLQGTVLAPTRGEFAAVAIHDPRSVRRTLKQFRPVGQDRQKVETLRIESLQLDLEKTPFAFCFILRSMFEISAKAYSDDHTSEGLSTTKSDGTDKKLVQVLREITSHLTKNNTDKAKVRDLHGAMTELGKSDGILSVTSMNQLIHNPTFSIAVPDLCRIFANIFPLLKAMN